MLKNNRNRRKKNIKNKKIKPRIRKKFVGGINRIIITITRLIEIEGKIFRVRFRKLYLVFLVFTYLYFILFRPWMKFDLE